MMNDPLIIYFDGVCNLCNAFVDFLVRIDRAQNLRYAPLQGETARQRGVVTPVDLETGGEGFRSILVVERGQILRESDAVACILIRVGGVWKFFAVFRFVPKCVRDGVYRLVARNRYRIFGRRDTCRAPAPEEKQLFLP